MLAAMADLPDRPHSEDMRTSDADRERIAALLHKAAAEGRLDLAELDERLGKAYAARTYAELVPLTQDLPVAAATPVPPGGPDRPDRTARDRRWVVAVMSGFRRAGRWSAPRLLRCVAFWGGGVIDLRSAELVAGEIHIQVFAVMGGATVIVPKDADVSVTGIGIMGGFGQDGDAREEGGAPTRGPRVRISGFAFWGGVGVRRG